MSIRFRSRYQINPAFETTGGRGLSWQQKWKAISVKTGESNLSERPVGYVMRNVPWRRNFSSETRFLSKHLWVIFFFQFSSFQFFPVSNQSHRTCPTRYAGDVEHIGNQKVVIKPLAVRRNWLVSAAVESLCGLTVKLSHFWILLWNINNHRMQQNATWWVLRHVKRVW